MQTVVNNFDNIIKVRNQSVVFTMTTTSSKVGAIVFVLTLARPNACFSPWLAQSSRLVVSNKSHGTIVTLRTFRSWDRFAFRMCISRWDRISLRDLALTISNRERSLYFSLCVPLQNTSVCTNCDRVDSTIKCWIFHESIS